MEDEKVVKAMRMCVNKSCKDRLSKSIVDVCPYYPEKRCQEVLMKDALSYIEKLKESEVQPLLPGVELIDRSTGRVMSDREAREYVKTHPETSMMFERIA